MKKIIPIVVLIVVVVGVGGFWIGTHHSSTSVTTTDTTITVKPAAQTHKEIPFVKAFCEQRKYRAEHGIKQATFAPEDDPCKDYK